jgi:hypothetical protein
MTANALTRQDVAALAARMRSDDADEAHDALVELGTHCGTGTPLLVLDDLSREIGPDYVCALDTGEIVAWGADFGTHRELGIYTAAQDFVAL